jgi:hypothetical protein
MNAIEETTTVQPNGTLVLSHPELRAGERVKVIVLRNESPVSSVSPSAAGEGRKLKQDWAGGLKDLAPDFTSLQLQRKASEWRGD